MKYRSILLWISLLSFHVYSQQGSSMNNRHDYNTPLPNHIKNVLDKHKEIIRNAEHNVNHFKWLPGWMVKKDEYGDRIEGAKIFSQAIYELGCNKLIVPKKYRYRSPNNHDYTISEKLKDSGKELNLDEFKQILRLAKRINWTDGHSCNFIKVHDGLIGLIDTETNSINNYKDHWGRGEPGRKLKITASVCGLKLTKDAYIYRANKLEHYHHLIALETHKTIMKYNNYFYNQFAV